MKTKRNRILLIVAVLLAAAILPTYISWQWREHRIIKQSEPIQASLERFRQEHGNYPVSLAEISVAEPIYGHLEYIRNSDTSYRLQFLKRPGVALTYNSTEHKWQ